MLERLEQRNSMTKYSATVLGYLAMTGVLPLPRSRDISLFVRFRSAATSNSRVLLCLRSSRIRTRHRRSILPAREEIFGDSRRSIMRARPDSIVIAKSLRREFEWDLKPSQEAKLGARRDAVRILTVKVLSS